MDKLDMLIRRRRGVSIYRILSALQFSMGLLLIFFAFYTVVVVHGKESDLPYFAGAFIAGIACTAISCLGGLVYYNGKNTHLEVLVSINVKPLVKIYMIVSPCASCFCIAGTVITAIYGLCLSSKCSYSANKDYNFGMAMFLLTLDILALISTVFGIAMCLYYSSVFGINIFPKRSVVGVIQVKPPHADEHEAQVQRAQDMYALQQWRHNTETDVDFGKVAVYLEHTRKQRPMRSYDEYETET